MCKWYTIEIDREDDDREDDYMVCDITTDETSCAGDVGKCECEYLRQDELKAEARDIKSDADRENKLLT